MNSQSKDPSITAAEAVAKESSDEATGTGEPAGAPAEDVLPLREDKRGRAGGQGGGGQGGGGQGGGGANRGGQRLREIKGGRGGQGANGMGRAARAVVPEAAAEAFAPEPQEQQPSQPVAVPLRPRQMVASMAATMTARQPVAEAQIRPRHLGIMALAFLMIIVPGIVTSVYMWGFAVDQYVSTAGFAIRNQNAVTSPFDFLGAFGGGSSSTAKDTDILYNFVASQELVAKLDKQIGVQTIYSKPKNDPLFSYDTSGTIEDLVKYWSRMVQVQYDNSTGLMRLHVYAFTPEDAQNVAKVVLSESTDLVNRLAAVARDDTMKYAKKALDDAESNLKAARTAMTQFRVANNVVDPTIEISSQASVVGSLTQQLVQAQIELAMLQQQGVASASDPRMATLQTRIGIIQSRISEEQSKVGVFGGSKDNGYAEIIATYQSLTADLEFSEKAYMTALASYDVAVEDAQHKQVYLATYEEPTLAQAASSPQRWLMLIAVMVIGFLAWSITTLIYYALRDRR